MSKTIDRNAEPIAGYRLLRYLGRGGFGEVWEAEAPGELRKAVKIAPVDVAPDGINCRELEGLRKIRSVRHPYLLSIERFEVVDSNLVIVMELADKSLAERFDECAASGMPGVPRDELLRYLREAAEVLDLINDRHGLQHLDVKPENLFLSSDHVKVADFGLVQPRNTSISRAAVAISPPYAPPELFDGRIEPTADQYSLAVTYMELLTGQRPYDASDVRSLVLQHLRGRPDLSALPPGERAIVGRALSREPSDRYGSCTEFLAALSRASGSAFGGGGVNSAEAAPLDARTETVRMTPRGHGGGTQRAKPLARRTPRRAAATTEVSDLAPKARSKALSALISFEGHKVRAEAVSVGFVAFLPIDIFAHKLRGFIDAMGAEILSCTDDRTVLYLGGKGWFGRRDQRAMFIEVQTFSRNPHSGFRVVEVKIWSANRRIDGTEFGRRGMLLVRVLKSYLMATDDAEPRKLQSDRAVLDAVLA